MNRGFLRFEFRIRLRYCEKITQKTVLYNVKVRKIYALRGIFA